MFTNNSFEVIMCGTTSKVKPFEVSDLQRSFCLKWQVVPR